MLLLATGVYLLFNLNSDFGRLAERVMAINGMIALRISPPWL